MDVPPDVRFLDSNQVRKPDKFLRTFLSAVYLYETWSPARPSPKSRVASLCETHVSEARPASGGPPGEPSSHVLIHLCWQNKERGIGRGDWGHT